MSAFIGFLRGERPHRSCVTAPVLWINLERKRTYVVRVSCVVAPQELGYGFNRVVVGFSHEYSYLEASAFARNPESGMCSR